MVCCVLKGINAEVLWDTGEQVSILSIDWLQCYLPNTQVLPISALMEGEESLHISTADGTATCIHVYMPRPYKGKNVQAAPDAH